jgi:DNA primase
LARGLSRATLDRYRDQIRISDGGDLMFAHRKADGTISGYEIKGPGTSMFAEGGNKQVCALGRAETASRIVVCESAIDALSLAQLENCREDTVYVSTGGGFGSRTVERLAEIVPGRALVIATDADQAGARYEKRLTGLPAATVERLAPPAGKDWNDMLIESQKAGQSHGLEM